MFDNRIALSVREAAEATGYSPRHIRHHIAAGKLKASPPGGDGDMRILREDLMEWLRAEAVPRKVRPAPAYNTRTRAA